MNNNWLDILSYSKPNGILDEGSLTDSESCMNRLMLRNIELEAQVRELIEGRKDEQMNHVYFAQALNFVNIGFIVLDAFGKVKQINAAAANMFERAPSDVISRSLFALVSHPDKLRSVVTWLVNGFECLDYQFDGENSRTIKIEKHILANDEYMLICR